MNSQHPNRRDALPNMKKRKSKLAALQSHLKEGASQAQRGEYENVSADEFLNQMKSETNLS